MSTSVDTLITAMWSCPLAVQTGVLLSSLPSHLPFKLSRAMEPPCLLGSPLRVASGSKVVFHQYLFHTCNSNYTNKKPHPGSV